MKYLLTGASGTLGTELKKYLNCYAPTSKDLDVRSFVREKDDLTDPVFRFEHNDDYPVYNVDTLIHAAAWTDVPGAEINKDEAVKANIIGTYNMAKYAHSREWKFVYISTDYVYPGHIGNYKETDKTEPFNFYGFTKLAGESFANKDKDLIIRTSFKPNDLWEKKYNKAFIDLYTSADYADIVAKEIALVIKHKLTGIINVGTEKKSIYQLATSRYPNVGEMSRWDVNDWIKMPTDISMNIDKFTEFKKSLEEPKDE
jgi:dTDP-4-dehydrorhamnose reductase